MTENTPDREPDANEPTPGQGSAPPAGQGRSKRWLQTSAVAAAGLVAGSALTFAITAQGSTQNQPDLQSGYARFGPGGPVGQGRPDGQGGQPPGQSTTQEGQGTQPSQATPTG